MKTKPGEIWVAATSLKIGNVRGGVGAPPLLLSPETRGVRDRGDFSWEYLKKKKLFLNLVGVGCGRDVDEALESFPFVRNVSLLGLLAAEEKAGAEILGILLAGAGEGEKGGYLGRLILEGSLQKT